VSEELKILDLGVWFNFLEWPAKVWRGWGSIYSPHKIITVVVSKDRSSPVVHRKSLVNHYGSWCWPDWSGPSKKSGGGTEQVR
jgi:hypothetical protein